MPDPDADAPAQSLEGWLLTVPQLRSGVHAGAVAGLLADGVTASYVYPEIAGYYLRWLAFRAVRGDDASVLSKHAQAAQRWLVHWRSLDGPPTRVHLDGTIDDWRNHALFCFDLAMVLRGLGSAAHAGLLVADAPLVDTLAMLLARCIASDGSFDAVVPLAPHVSLPDRWSTRRGAFLAKAAAGVLRAAGQLPSLPPSLARAAERTLVHSTQALAQAPHPESHPLLYACEGILDLPQHAGFANALPLVAERFDALLARATADGHLPESVATGTTGPLRVDVIAQALRVGHLLTVHRAQRPPDRVALKRLRHALARHVRDDGGVGFAQGAPSVQRNTWAAMFADQARAYAAPAGRTDAWWRGDPLIV